MPLKVCYIDDEPELLEIFTALLSENGIEIETYHEAQSGLEAVLRNPPDVLFLDLQLPGMTGDEIALASAPEIPKYLITGNLSVKPRANYLGVLPKPVDYQEIKKIIQSLLAARTAAA